MTDQSFTVRISREREMTVLAHPLFFVFAFSLLVCVAGICWLLLLRQRREGADHEQPTSPPREGERSVMEILQDGPRTIPLAEHGPLVPRAVKLDKSDPAQQTIMREEAKSRLSVMDELIGEQRSRIASARTRGMNVTLMEEQLNTLTETREEYFAALKRLLTEFVDGESAKGGIA